MRHSGCWALGVVWHRVGLPFGAWWGGGVGVVWMDIVWVWGVDGSGGFAGFDIQPSGGNGVFVHFTFLITRRCGGGVVAAVPQAGGGWVAVDEWRRVGGEEWAGGGGLGRNWGEGVRNLGGVIAVMIGVTGITFGSVGL